MPASTDAWDQYWRDGRLASCGGEGGATYQPLIADGWRGFFASLGCDARILDACCGNGAVARLAADAALLAGRRFMIDAVDSANLNPEGAGAAAGMIRWHPRTSAEQLPFAAGSFDVVVSQYGIEYTNLALTLAQLRRTSHAGARVRFVTHASNSVVVQGANRQRAEAERLLATGVFAAAQRLARSAASSPRDQGGGEARAAFLATLQSLRNAEAVAEDVRMHRNVGDVLVHAIAHQPEVGLQPVLEKVAELEAAIRAHRDRLSSMCAAALDPPRARALAAEARRLWDTPFTVDLLKRADGAAFGWVIQDRRDAQRQPPRT